MINSSVQRNSCLTGPGLVDFAIGLVKHVVNLPITVADPDLQIRGRGRGALSKKFFSALGASVWSKNKGGGGRPPGALS